MITPTAHDKEEHLLFGGIETETSGQLTSDVLKQAKREIEADWVRVEALCISCHPRTPANLVIVIIFSGSFLLKLMIPWKDANFHASVTLMPMRVVVNLNQGSFVSHFFSNAKLACQALLYESIVLESPKK